VVACLVPEARPKVAAVVTPTTLGNDIGGGQFTDFF